MQIFHERFFPFYTHKRLHFKNRCIIGIGGNIGDVKKRFQKLFFYFSKQKRLHVKQTSCILKNPPFGFLEQNDFYNALIEVQTSMPPRELLKFLMHTEKRFKRKRSFKNAPRTLDLDIIFFNNISYNHKKLKIPHPFWMQRDSVLIPLSQLKLDKGR
jgi:2-amino-4-hydroxy-6-hydroxymethyldihydropteridine diphosphokinase